MERVVGICNRALADSRRAERFLQLSADGQIATFVFGVPGAIRRLAEEFHLPLSDDLNEAMEDGKAYGRQVLDGMEDNSAG